MMGVRQTKEAEGISGIGEKRWSGKLNGREQRWVCGGGRLTLWLAQGFFSILCVLDWARRQGLNGMEVNASRAGTT